MCPAPDASRRGPDPERPNGSIEVVIIEDMRDVREGLAALIDGTPGFRCARSYRTMEDALAGAGIGTSEVILTDIALPGMSGIEGIRVLRVRFPDIPILALTVHDSDEQGLRRALRGRIRLPAEEHAARRLLEALREVAAGGAPMSPEVARRVVRLFREFRPPDRAPYRLTPQESELLKLLADGHHRKTAAHELGISVNTVAFHLKNVYEKLQVHSKTEAVAKALRERLI